MSIVLQLTRHGQYCDVKLTVQPTRVKPILFVLNGNSSFVVSSMTPVHYMLPLRGTDATVVFVHVFLKSDMLMFYIPESVINSCSKSVAFVSDLGGALFSTAATSMVNFIVSTNDHTLELVNNNASYFMSANLKDFLHLFGLNN